MIWELLATINCVSQMVECIAVNGNVCENAASQIHPTPQQVLTRLDRVEEPKQVY